jgi:hypothetical protein
LVLATAVLLVLSVSVLVATARFVRKLGLWGA